jgi:hypothetical protein
MPQTLIFEARTQASSRYPTMYPTGLSLVSSVPSSCPEMIGNEARGSCDASPGTLIHLNSLHLPLILLHRSYLIFFFSSPSVTLLSVLFQIGTISGRHRSLLLCSPCFSLSSSSLLFPFFLARPATPPRRLNQEAPFPTSVSAFLYKRVYLLPLTYST